MRKMILGLALGLGVLVALGCGGIAEQLANLADVEVQTGEDAVHPADFPLPPPETGTIVNSNGKSTVNTVRPGMMFRELG